MIDLKKLAKEINIELEKRRKEIELTFIEDKHIYYMKNDKGVVTDKWPSVSKIYKQFHSEFDSQKKSLEMAKGDLNEQRRLLKEWKDKGTRSTNLGSRTHFLLEQRLIEMYDDYKDLRYPIFHCDKGQTDISDRMVKAGHDYIDLMHKRGAVLLDTEIVLGDPELGYTGQPDKGWLMLNQKEQLGFIITDWKTNQRKNFVKQWYTDKMYNPFQIYDNTALSHYYLQGPLYGRLLLKMLENTKFKDIKLFGGVVVLLEENGTFEEFKIPQDVVNKVLNLNMINYV